MGTKIKTQGTKQKFRNKKIGGTNFIKKNNSF
jgi:hypothetical protein